MVTIFTEYYLEGLLAGCAVTLVLIVVFFIFYFRAARIQKAEEQRTFSPEAEERQSFRKVVGECLCVFCVALVLFLILYLWITPLMPYSGTVEKKDNRASHRKTKSIRYFIYVDGTKRTVDKSIYDIVEPDDVIRHRMASQVYRINEHPHVAVDFAWNTAFWGGMLLILLTMICSSILYFHFRV